MHCPLSLQAPLCGAWGPVGALCAALAGPAVTPGGAGALQLPELSLIPPLGDSRRVSHGQRLLTARGHGGRVRLPVNTPKSAESSLYT